MLQRLVGPLQALVEFHREDRGRDKCINADRFPGVGRAIQSGEVNHLAAQQVKRRTVSFRSPVGRLTHLVSLSLNGVFRPTRQGHRENLEAETSAQDGDAS
jgi:hypothetical protein